MRTARLVPAPRALEYVPSRSKRPERRGYARAV